MSRTTILDPRSTPVTVKGADLSFDRVLSIEMFEHMKNYEFLLKKVSTWLKPSGKLFVHIFCHKSDPYDMESGAYLLRMLADSGWMSTYFFTGGTFPSADLFLYFQRHLVIEKTWHVNGTFPLAETLIKGKHYARTCEDWLRLLLKHQNEAKNALRETYGDKANIWFNRWIVFFLVASVTLEILISRVAPSCSLIMMAMNGLLLITCSRKDKRNTILKIERLFVLSRM
jgi:cyclopropane fatty-acyl-phospholipid synthase-like methyltransferase